MTYAAHPYWLFREDIQQSGKVRSLWQADVPAGEWIATAHMNNPNMHGECVEARSSDRDGLLLALRSRKAS